MINFSFSLKRGENTREQRGKHFCDPLQFDLLGINLNPFPKSHINMTINERKEAVP
jgi:hypothetical protein